MEEAVRWGGCVWLGALIAEWHKVRIGTNVCYVDIIY